MASSASEDYDMRIRFGTSIPHPRVLESLEDKLLYVSSGIKRAVELMCRVRECDKSSGGSCAALAGKAVGLMEGIKSLMEMSMLAHTAHGQEMCGLTSKLKEVHVTASEMAVEVQEQTERLRRQKVHNLWRLAVGFLFTPIAVGVIYNYKLSTAKGQQIMEAFVWILISTVLTHLFGVVWTCWEDERKKVLAKLEQQGEFAAWIERAVALLYNDVNHFIAPHIPPPSEPATPSDDSVN